MTSSPDATHPGGLTASGTASLITVTGLTNATRYTFTVTVTATNSAGTSAASQPSNAITPTAEPKADLAVKITHAAAFRHNRTGQYKVTVFNTGTAATAATTMVTDTLPAGVTYASASGYGWTCTATGQTVTCTRTKKLNAGASSTLTIKVKVTAAATMLSNTVSVSPTDGTPADNSATDQLTVQV